MRLLIGTTCVAIIAFVGYFFWGEYAKNQAAQRVEQTRRQTALNESNRQKYKECDDAVSTLQAIIDANISANNDVFAKAQRYVDHCLRENKDSDWYHKNIGIKSWN